MQRVSAFLPSWEKRNSGTKPGTKPGALFGWGQRNSAPGSKPSKINVAVANGGRIERETFWPASLDLECDKAARILKSFCSASLAPGLCSLPTLALASSPIVVVMVPRC